MFRRFTSRSEVSHRTEQCEHDEEYEMSFEYCEGEGDDGTLRGQLHQEYIPSPEQRASSKYTYHGAAAVDIVLVHGLGSKYKTTWAYTRKDGSRYHWIREKFPKDMPDARILGFEYPSRWYDDPVKTSLTECASQLLRALISDRCHEGSREMCRTRRARPIIFVGHSFGGLVIKQAMVMASHVLSTNSSRTDFENHRDILSAVAGVVFLGTPHRGSSFAILANLKIGWGNRILRVSSNDEIITILTPNSYVLDELQRTFSQLCFDERMRRLKLVCYYEMKEIDLLRRLVVSRDSACLDGVPCRGMDVNHMNMNTFYDGDGGRHDSNYEHFLSDIRSIFHQGLDVVPERFNNWVYGSLTPDAERERLQRWLDPSRDIQTITYTEKLDIQRSAPYTCQWIHDTAEFKAWKGADESNALWISGTAGSGKSVLAAYIIKCLKDAGEADNGHFQPCSAAISEPCGYKNGSVPVLMFFCGVDRKSESTERILATLVHQLLLARPESQELFEVAQDLYQESLTGDETQSAILAKYLGHMAALVGPVFIVIDNLEDIPEPGLLIKKLSVLRHSEKVRILLSSQETDQIADALSEHFGVERPLLITDHSAADIKRFARSRGAALVESKPQLLEKSDFIMKTLEEKAHGMFQWVNSALEHLRSVEDARDVESKLNGMRQDLIGTYDKIFERLSIGRDEAEVRRIQTALKWIAANATPVTAVDVKVAYMIQEMIYQKNNGVASDEATAKMERDVRSLFEKEESREVAEKEIKKYLGTIVNVSSDGTLNFKHPTIQRALTKPDEVPNPSSKFKFALTDAHHDIALVCMTVCQMTTFIHANSFLDWRVPLVQYAWNFWAYHVKNAKMPFTALKDIDKIKNLLGGYPGISDHLTRHLRFQSAFDKMMDSVTRDALLYLEALMDFMSRPLRAVNGRFSDREYVLSLQRAQDSLIQPTRDLCALRRSLSVPISAQLALVAIDVRAASAQQQACPRTTLSTLGRRASDRVAGAKSVLLGSSTTTVTALSLDSYLATNTTVPRPRGATQLLAEIARNLRLTTLRFAVDPMYSALLLTADGTSFSPLHPIVYLAQLLEEAGRYPYWDALPPGTDLMEPFICASTDPEFPSAKFVLHCFEWRDPRLTTTDVVVSASQKPGSALEHSGGYYVRTAGLHIDLRPSPGTGEPLGLTRVSTENWEQVKRLHEMKASQFFAARGTYALFRSDDEWLNKQVINPLAALHMKFSLVIEEHPLDVAYMQEDPVAMLNHYAPTEVREAPLRSLVLSVPHILKSAFIHYVVLLLEVFGRISRQVLTSHWTKIEAALKELQGVLALWKRMLPGSWGESRDISGNEIPRLSPVYAVPAGILFVLRCRYWPTLGAHIWYHGWGQFNYAWKHPAAYVDLQNTLYSSFWSFLWSLLRFLVILGIGEAAVAYTKRPQGMEAVGWFGHATATYAVFHSLCSLDRSLFAIAAAVATLLSCAQLMFHDAETVAELFRASFFFWFALFFQFVVAMIQAGALEKGAGLWAIFGGAAVHVTVIVVCAVYYVPITGFFWACMKPARRLARWVWIHRLGASVVVAKGIGMALLIAAVWKAYWLMHKFVWDPYDIEDSLKKLLQTTRMVRETLGVNPSSKLVTAGATSTADLKRIGWYPLGTKRPRQAPQITPNDQPQPPATGPPPSRRPPTSRSLTTLSQASTLVGESLSSSSASTAGATTGATTPSAAVAGDNPTAFSESLQARGSALAATPMHATSRSAHEAFSREAGQAVDGLREYLASPSGLKRDASLLGRKLDDAVVASGEGIGRAVDWGLESVGGAVGKVGEVGGRLMLEAGSKIGEVGGRLMLEAGDKMSEAALVVRDERVGKLKEE